MLQTIKNYVYGTGISPINTIIGGVASTISTKSALATKLGVPEYRIRRFEIVGSDVHANINGIYNITTGFTFKNDLTITKFIDSDGICKSTFTSTFEGASNLTELKMKGITTLVANFIFNTPNLNTVEFGVLTRIESNGGSNSAAIYPTDNVTSLGNSAFINNKHTTIDLSSMTSIVNSSPIRGSTLATSLLMPNVTSIASSVQFFQNLTSCNYINLKKLKTYGIYASGASEFNLGFQNLKMGCTIDVNVSMLTANSGSPHEAFVWVKNNRGAIVKFYDDDGNYVSTL